MLHQINISLVVFIILAIVSIVSALLVILNKNLIYSVLSLIILFFSISGHYIFLNAQFLAIINLIVYAGAVMVLFLFVVMLMNLNTPNTEFKTNNVVAIISVVVSGCFALVILMGLKTSVVNTTNSIIEYPSTIGLVKQLGRVLFEEYAIPFELTGVLFLSTIIGSIILAKSKS